MNQCIPCMDLSESDFTLYMQTFSRFIYFFGILSPRLCQHNPSSNLSTVARHLPSVHRSAELRGIRS